jgi:translation elongation factor EF-Ts
MKSQDSKLNAEVQKLAGDLSLHLAAMKPNYLTEQDVPQDVRNKVMEDLPSEEEKKRSLEKLFSQEVMMDQELATSEEPIKIKELIK